MIAETQRWIGGAGRAKIRAKRLSSKRSMRQGRKDSVDDRDDVRSSRYMRVDPMPVDFLFWSNVVRQCLVRLCLGDKRYPPTL